MCNLFNAVLSMSIVEHFTQSVKYERGEKLKVDVGRIKHLCKERKISISALERDAGIAKGYVFKWDKHEPSASTIAEVAKILEVPMEELMKQ